MSLTAYSPEVIVNMPWLVDPRRTAILLIGGDKRGEWKAWYRTAIPLADDLYDAYLADLQKEGLLPRE
jgi:hypothetical protein